MSLQHELGLQKPIEHPGHDLVLGVMLTGEMMAKEGSRLLRPFKLTDSQFNVLMLLKYQTGEDGGISQSRLGDMLLVNRSNVTGLVDRLAEARLVERVALKGDRRVKRVRLTPAGHRLVERAEKAYFTRIDALTAALGEADTRRLGKALERLRKALRT